MAAELDAATLAQHLDDPMWRLSNLYKIITKGADGEDGLVVHFKPNRAQRRLLARLWYRNIILKARQLGFTTLICILWLDTALFSKSPIRCGVIAQDKDAAEIIFRDKVKFAYDNLPEALREKFPLRKDSASELLFAHNGASVRVGTSMRSGTIHRLLVSEFGKICAKNPQKAGEVVKGSIPAVPDNGIAVIESTAEGQEGHFYTMTQQAIAGAESGKPLTNKSWRFHFYAWWEEKAYSLHNESVEFTEADLTYFNKVEAQIGRTLTDDQWTWYVVTRQELFAGDAPSMWQEYPSYPNEAFQVSTEGHYYAVQLSMARLAGRICKLPREASPIHTFWDIGRGDMTSIWFMQKIGPDHRFVSYYEASGEDLSHYVEHLQKTGFIFGRHYLPHEASHKRMGKNADTNQSIEEMFQELMPGARIVVVPRITNLSSGIQQTRAAFASSWFDAVGCDKGLKRLQGYRKTWDETRGCWKEEPRHDDNSHGSDAYRQFGQVLASGEKFNAAFGPAKSSSKRSGSPMAV